VLFTIGEIPLIAIAVRDPNGTGDGTISAISVAIEGFQEPNAVLRIRHLPLRWSIRELSEITGPRPHKGHTIFGMRNGITGLGVVDEISVVAHFLKSVG
jgi:hypothetical protein